MEYNNAGSKMLALQYEDLSSIPRSQFKKKKKKLRHSGEEIPGAH